MPNLNITQIKNPKFRVLKKMLIKKLIQNLTGYMFVLKWTFCFPIILFCRTSGEKNWSQNGINDLAHLNTKISTCIKLKKKMGIFVSNL